MAKYVISGGWPTADGLRANARKRESNVFVFDATHNEKKEKERKLARDHAQGGHLNSQKKNNLSAKISKK